MRFENLALRGLVALVTRHGSAARIVSTLAVSLGAGAFATGPASAIESQALTLAASLPPQVRQVFGCGEWAEAGATGGYRIVLVDVNWGAGTEVYVQRIRSGESPRVLDTTPIRELNDDHAQYLVSSARCVGTGRKRAVELMAAFEHDADDVQRLIRIALGGPGSYTVRNTVVRSRR